MKITKWNWNKLTVETQDTVMLFDSKEEMEEFMVANFEYLPNRPRSGNGYSLSRWERVLTKRFGQQDWRKGIRVMYSNSQCTAYAGETLLENIGIRVWGEDAGGNEWYGYTRTHRWEKM